MRGQTESRRVMAVAIALLTVAAVVWSAEAVPLSHAPELDHALPQPHAAAGPEAGDYLHPQFHVMPPTNWMNDPNGPVYYQGVYHLFYQYNPYGAVWGNMSWGHAASTDLAFWTALPVALTNDEPYDVGGVFSGSITVVDNIPVIAYTCVDGSGNQAQCVAQPVNASDPLLQRWQKSKENPVIPVPPSSVPSDSFRDPTTAWSAAGQPMAFTMTVGASLAGQGAALLYGTETAGMSGPELFTNWSYTGILYTNTNLGGMWECPDFYPVQPLASRPHHPHNIADNDVWWEGDAQSKDKHRKQPVDDPPQQGPYVLKMSANGQDWYYVGEYNPSNGTGAPFTPFTTPQLYDGGHFYASKRFYDGQRHILFGWSSEEDDNGVARGWQGLQTLPRQVSFDPVSNRLVFTPVPELEKLRCSSSTLQSSEQLAAGQILSTNISSNQFEMQIDIARPAFALATYTATVLASTDNTQRTDIVLQITNVSATVSIDRSKSGSGSSEAQSVTVPLYTTDTSVQLWLFVDHSVVETYLQQGRGVITSRVYPDQGSEGVFVSAGGSNSGTSSVTVQSWQLSSIWNGGSSC